MALYNFGSITAQLTYAVDRLPEAGATMVADRYDRQLAGAGANQSVAAHRAGCPVRHIGMVSEFAMWVYDALRETGVDISMVDLDPQSPMAHTMVFETPEGSHHTVAFKGANGSLDPRHALNLLEALTPDDILMMQNETNAQRTIAAAAKEQGVRVVYTAAPFSVAAILEVLPSIDLLALHRDDLDHLSKALQMPISELPVAQILVLDLLGHKLTWMNLESGHTLPIALPNLDVIDANGALDACVGYFCAGLCLCEPVEASLAIAGAAGALQASRIGAAETIPDLVEVKTLMHSPA